MTLTRWNPFREMEEMMNQYARGSFASPGTREVLTTAQWTPAVDIVEDDKEYVIKVELPEIPKDDVNVQVNDGVLTISGERKHEVDDRKRHRTERYYGRFARSFSLPDDVGEEGIEATHKDGMLYLHLAKQPKVTPRSIEIKAH